MKHERGLMEGEKKTKTVELTTHYFIEKGLLESIKKFYHRDKSRHESRQAPSPPEFFKVLTNIGNPVDLPSFRI